jgi:hypothetical protein
VHFSAIEGVAVGEDTFGIPKRLSDQIPGKSFRPILEDPRALSLRPLSADSDEGITRPQFPAVEGAPFPRRIHLRSRHISRGSIVSLSVTRTE